MAITSEPRPVSTAPGAEDAPDAVARSWRLGLVQSRSTIGTESLDPRDDNLSRALRAIERLADDDVQLVVFGELYLSGYRTDEWLHRWASRLSPPDRHVQALLDIARRRDIYVLMGMATVGAFMPGDLYNSAALFGPEGLVGVYRKAHVAAFPYMLDGRSKVSTERAFYAPGKELPVFDTRLGRIGVQICYDVTFPEVSRVQAIEGAEILINVSASAAGFESYWDHLLYVRAAENASWFAVCSVVGDQRGDMMFGGSRVVDPSGTTVATGKYNEEDVVIATIDPDAALRNRAMFHTFSARKPELYGAIARPTRFP